MMLDSFCPRHRFVFGGVMCPKCVDEIATYQPKPVTAEEVRKIIREELERLGVGKSEEQK
jgi:hypothetical protein